MAERRWGVKRKCVECSAAFYDLKRMPIRCPKCGAVHQPVALLASDGRQHLKNRKRRFGAAPGSIVEPAAEKAEPAAAEGDEAVVDEEAEDEVAPIDDDSEDVLEPTEEQER